MGKTGTKRATIIGVICIATYLSNYYMRHILSVLSPRLLETGRFTVEHVGLLSSVYMAFYAAGQLVNGFLGDLLSPKKMVAAGLTVAGTSLGVFPFFGVPWVQVICFAVFGFGLSMVRGPLMKIISENTEPNQARTICVFFSFASFAGPLVASLFALIHNWFWVFIAAGGTAVAAGVAAYCGFSVMEKKGQLSYQSTKGQGLSSILSVFKIEKFFFFVIVACLVEICAASISFWIPTLLTEKMHFSKTDANMIYTGISVVRSCMPFAALMIFRAVKERDIAMMRVTFTISSVMFASMLLAPNRWATLGCMLLALMAMSCTSALLWSIHIPSLGKTGKVSSVNGVLDCIGYIAAAVANMIFAGMVGKIGWNGVFILWSGIAAVGLVAALFVKQQKKSPEEEIR